MKNEEGKSGNRTGMEPRLKSDIVINHVASRRFETARDPSKRGERNIAALGDGLG